MTILVSTPAPGRWRPRLATALLLLAALSACGDSASEPVDPPRAVAIAVSPQSVTLTSLGETAAFSATITDQFGAGFAGTATWATSDPGVFLASASGVVTAAGNGSGTLTASFEALGATAQVVVAQVPAAIVVVSGDGQEGMPGGTLAEAVVVQVEDGGGSPVAGAMVTFAAAEGHGTADPATADTDADGLASTTWTLGDAAGAQTLTASVAGGVSADVRAIAGGLAPPPDSAVYRVVFNATWSATTHPNSFPRGAHFSSLIGAMHNDAVRFWARGETASRGIESMAETGATGNLASEIRAEIPGDALSVINGPGLGSPGQRNHPPGPRPAGASSLDPGHDDRAEPGLVRGGVRAVPAGRVRVGERAGSRPLPVRLGYRRRDHLHIGRRRLFAQAADPEPPRRGSVLGRADRDFHLHACGRTIGGVEGWSRARTAVNGAGDGRTH